MNGVTRRSADLHRHRLLPGPEALVLAGVGERVQLAVAVRACRPGPASTKEL